MNTRTANAPTQRPEFTRPEFSSVRAVNKAARDAANGRLRGKYVYLRRLHPDGHPYLTRIARTSTHKGQLQALLLTFKPAREWVDCEFFQIITQ